MKLHRVTFQQKKKVPVLESRAIVQETGILLQK